MQIANSFLFRPLLMAKRGYISASQKELLVEFVGNNPALVSGKHSQEFTAAIGRQKWEEVSEKLNAIPGGAKKDWVKWRKAWQDLKMRTKQKRAAIQRHARGTGGGSPLPETLTSAEEDISALITPVSSEGLSGIVETPCQYVTGAAVPKEEQLPYLDEPNTTQALPSSAAPLDQTLEQPGPSVTLRSSPAATTPRQKMPLKKQQVLAAEKLIACCKKRQLTKETYYERKLALLERDVVAKETIATSLVALLRIHKNLK